MREHEGAADAHRFTTSLGHESIVGNWDPARIGRVLDNLLGNAVKFTPGGGTVEVEVDRDAVAATVTITDHGIGIAPQDLGRIFLPMYRGANASAVAGTGLEPGGFAPTGRDDGWRDHRQEPPGQGLPLSPVHLPVAGPAGNGAEGSAEGVPS